MVELNRRRFVGGLVAVASSALCRGAASLAPDPCLALKLSDVYRRQRAANSLSVSFLGTFAIFVHRDRIDAYAPSIVDDQGQPLHDYWLAKPDPGQVERSNQVFDLATPNKIEGITGTAPVPTFVVDPDKSNNIDPNLSLLLDTMPPPPNFLHQLSLPLPDDVLLRIWSKKHDGVSIFAHQKDFCWIAREHQFIYNQGRFDVGKLKFNGSPIRFFPGEDLSIRILSEPKDDNQMAQECAGMRHVQRAMQGLAQMLGKSPDEFKIDERYCNQQILVAQQTASISRKEFNSLGGGGEGSGAVSASRFPACMSVVINHTNG